jgi:hypothetical protein
VHSGPLAGDEGKQAKMVQTKLEFRSFKLNVTKLTHEYDFDKPDPLQVISGPGLDRRPIINLDY